VQRVSDDDISQIGFLAITPAFGAIVKITDASLLPPGAFKSSDFDTDGETGVAPKTLVIQCF
jgi:hypothetical protein